MTGDGPYLNRRFMGEVLDSYRPGGYHPVYLGDTLNKRYTVFRKLGTGNQLTAWLARDRHAAKRRFVVLKIHTAQSTPNVQKLTSLLYSTDDPAEKYLEIPIDTFVLHRPNGDHLCTVVEPLGDILIDLVDEAYEVRRESEEEKPIESSVTLKDPWSVSFAKQACWQMLQALDVLHRRGIAHRDIRQGTNRFALTEHLSTLNENEIQQPVWEEIDSDDEGQDPIGFADDDSDDSDDEPLPQWVTEIYECRRRTKEQWQATERGDPNAEPHSEEWCKANFFKSRDGIELPQRRDGDPLRPDEVQYTVRPRSLAPEHEFTLDRVTNPEQPFRLILTGLGSACLFEDCEKRGRLELGDYSPPEDLVGATSTHKADISRLGFWFWEVVMLRALVEYQPAEDDPGDVKSRGRSLHSISRRIGPAPAALRAEWVGVDEWVDSEGHPLDKHDLDEDVYGDHPYPLGDIWEHARQRKPPDMSTEDMDLFVRLILKMLRWEPELRPSTADILQDEWFQDRKEHE